ncbi:MAG: AI-2E family transporter [Rickettsiaceae bacterium]|nr:AI-2E family transporter [Rickettsiaceae bacterium]
MQNLSKFIPGIIIAFLIYTLLDYLTFTTSLICISATFAYINNPLVKYLRNKFGFNLNTATAIAIFLNVVIFAIFARMLIPIIYNELIELSKKFPDYIVYLQKNLTFFTSEISSYGVDNVIKNFNEYLLRSIDQLLHSSITIANGIWNYTLFTLQIAVAIFVVPVLAYCFIINWEHIKTILLSLISKPWKEYLKPIISEIDDCLAGYLKGQMILIFWMSVSYSLGLWLINIEFHFLLGMISGICILLPIIGAVFSIALTLLISVIQYGFTIKLLYIAILYIVGHSIETYYLAPKVLGNHLGVSPIIVLLAILAAAELDNALLIFLAMPLLGITKILLKYFLQYYKKIYNIE